jgi:glyoxylase-like metal-dependent hydrolase (beta-lactamase superfamily II)
MPKFMCKTCGVQQAETAAPPSNCPICDDERQYVPESGQAWTTFEALVSEHKNDLREEEPNLLGIGVEPKFAIGQRALLVQSSAGNVLWDCVSLLDAPTITRVKALGGISAIALSHPHYYSAIVEWSAAFGDVPIYIHAQDRQWVQRPSRAIEFWEGDTLQLLPEMTLINCGGHFAGSTVLHWSVGAQGQGALLTGDTIFVVADRRYVTFMYSYPNLIPLRAASIQRIATLLEPYPFERIYSAWFGSVIKEQAKAAVTRSVTRYLNAIR